MKRRISYNLSLVIVTAAALISMLPIIFIVSNSIMGAGEAAARYTAAVTPYNVFGVISGNMHYVEMTFLPTFISTSAYRQVIIEEPENLRFLWNSILLTVPIVLGQLIIAPLAAYGFERAKSKHKDKLYFAYIIIMLLPMQALLVPHFIAAGILGLTSYMAIILPAVFAPFGVFLVRQQMKGFNKEMLEAAKVDGATELRIFTRVVVPNIMPTLTALGVLAFAEAWNIVDQAVVFIQNPFAMPMSVRLSAGGNMGIVFALSTLFMIPALIVFIYGQDDLGEGIGYGGK